MAENCIHVLIPSETTHHVKQAIQRQQNKQKHYYRGRRFIVFGVGEQVYVKDYRTPLKAKWICGNIRKRIGAATYLVDIPEIKSMKTSS